jgi:hypothetical protein
MLQLDLDTPLDNLLGFEHAPRNEKQRQSVSAMVEKLNKPGLLFVTTAAARCTPASAHLESPVTDANSGRKDNEDQAGGHADMEAQWNFSCEAPAALRSIEVRLFDVFPGLHNLDVQLVSPRGQSGAKLTTTARTLSW